MCKGLVLFLFEKIINDDDDGVQTLNELSIYILRVQYEGESIFLLYYMFATVNSLNMTNSPSKEL